MTIQTEETAVEHHGGVSGTIIGDRFYVLGGSNNPFTHLNSARVVPLKPDGQRFEIEPIPTPRANLVAASVGDRLFTIAGAISEKTGTAYPEGPSTIVEAFDTVKGAWETCAALPERRVKPGVAVVGDKIYALGGREDKLDANTIFAYDTTDNSWSEVGRLPYAARHSAACAHDDRVYCCGGFTAGEDNGIFQKALIEFDPQSGAVRQLADMPESRTAHSLVAHRGAIYSLGGVNERKQPTTTVYRYSIAEDRWTQCRDLQSVRAVFACGICGEQIILAGGWQRMHKEANPSEEIYAIES